MAAGRRDDGRRTRVGPSGAETDTANASSEARADALVITLRQLHTLKGNTAIFGLLGLSTTCHEIESRTLDAGQLAASDRALLGDAWERLEAKLRPLVGAEGRQVFEVRRTEHREVVAVLKTLDGAGDIVPVIEAWGLDPVGPRLERLAEHVRALGPRLGKGDVAAVASCPELRVDGEGWGGFWAALAHVVRNAVDHGIEAPEVRAAHGKVGTGRVELVAAIEDERFLVRVSDDGAGIDWGKVVMRAAERGLPVATEAERVEALFADGLTTRDDVTSVSGRGVGLAAVRAEVRARGGEIAVASTAGAGTTWSFTFPIAATRPRRDTTARVASATLARLRAAGRVAA